MKVNGATITASLSRATPVWTGASVTVGSTKEDKSTYKTSDGMTFNTQGELDAYLKTRGAANITALKVTSTVKAEGEYGLKGHLEGGATKTITIDKTTDANGTVTLTEASVTDPKATGNALAVWKILLQRKSRIQRKKNDGTNDDSGDSEYSDWETVSEANAPQ
jgi:hypothetical protein